MADCISLKSVGYGAALLAAFLLLSTPAARAVDFTVIYDPTDPQGIDPCAPAQLTVCPDGEPQTDDMVAVIEAAAQHWSDIVEDDHSITIFVSWFNPAFGSKPEASIEETDADGRTTVARIRIAPNVTYFYDPTPGDDDEFNMRPALFRTLHPTERMEVFPVEPVPAQKDAVELGDIGLIDDEDRGVDLLSIGLHEVGHVIGLSKERDQCSSSKPFYETSAVLSEVSFTFNSFLFVNDQGQDDNDCEHLALGGIGICKTFPEQETHSPDPSTVPGLSVQECTAHQALMWTGLYPGARSRPGAIDILAVAAAETWNEIDFPRKFSLSSGSWTDASRWFGPRAPDAGDDAYLANLTTTTIEANTNRSARSATISEGNILEVDGANLILSRSLRTLRIDSGLGPIVAVPEPPDDNGEVAPSVPATLRLRSNAGLQARDVLNQGRIVGAGLIGITHSFINTGVIRAQGGTLRIATPPPGGIVIDAPIVDLDGPHAFKTNQRLIAREGNLSIEAILNGPYRGRIEIGPSRRMSFTNVFAQAFSSQPSQRIVIDGGTMAGDLEFFSTVELEGIARIEGEAVLNSNAHLLYQAAGQVPGAEADTLFVDGRIQLGGTLVLNLENGFEPELGLVLTMIHATDEIVGTFGQFTLPPLDPALAWNVVQNQNNLLLSAVSAPSD